jgi:hypothetical protein
VIVPEPTDHLPPPRQTWAVHRQDDNGNRFVVRTGLGRDEAERLVAEFEAKGHKQLDWAEPESRPARTP